MMKYYRLRGLSHRSLCSHSFGDWRSEINTLAGLIKVSGGSSPVGLQMTAFM